MIINMTKAKSWLTKKLLDAAFFLIVHEQHWLAQKLLQFISTRLLGRGPIHFCKWKLGNIDGENCLVCKDCGRIVRDKNAAW